MFLKFLRNLFAKSTRPPRTTVTPPPQEKIATIVVTTADGERTTYPIPYIVLDQFPNLTFYGFISGDHYYFKLPPDTNWGWGATILIPQTEITSRVEERRIINSAIEPIQLPSPHLDPSGIPLEDLARIRGAMWTETLAVPFGPRPGAPNNVAATDFLWNYEPEDRLRIVQNLRALGYTHVVVGPLVDSDGYHGCWAPNDWRTKFADFLDMLQFFWDNGLAPIVFLKPDNWTFEQTVAELTGLLSQPRAQKLIRIIVPAGWEPTKYEWSSQTWAEFLKWGRETLPNALCLLHTVCDVDAPVGTDARGDDNGKDNALGWHRIAPYCHGWLTQTCTYERKDGTTDGKSNFQNWVDLFNPAIRGSYQDRFQHGYAGWPTFSAWGNRPMKVYAGEYLAYWTFWNGVPKEEARTWGDAALRAGADGYLDGGTLPVGEGPLPWQK